MTKLRLTELDHCIRTRMLNSIYENGQDPVFEDKWNDAWDAQWIRLRKYVEYMDFWEFAGFEIEEPIRIRIRNRMWNRVMHIARQCIND